MIPKTVLIFLFVAVALAAIVAAHLAWRGAYELFVDEYGVNCARVKIESDAGWHATRVTFFLDTPTLCSFAALAAGVFSLYGAARFYVAALTRRETARWVRYLICQVVGLAAAFAAALIYAYDFFTTAFDGVG